MEIKLYTWSMNLVYECKIPQFKVCPEVIFWGVRSFILDLGRSTIDYKVYIEAFTYTIVE